MYFLKVAKAQVSMPFYKISWAGWHEEERWPYSLWASALFGGDYFVEAWVYLLIRE